MLRRLAGPSKTGSVAPVGPENRNDGEVRAPLTHGLRLRLASEWRLVTGLGLQYGMLDSGLALHGTYGWPVIPAATLKGLAAARARQVKEDPELVRHVLGDPRQNGEPPAKVGEGPRGRGSVVFLDALPEIGGVKVLRDVVTPHQQPYYTSTFPSGEDTEDEAGTAERPTGIVPPAEHHSPVPAPFLSISGRLHVDLIGESP